MADKAKNIYYLASTPGISVWNLGSSVFAMLIRWDLQYDRVGQASCDVINYVICQLPSLYSLPGLSASNPLHLSFLWPWLWPCLRWSEERGKKNDEVWPHCLGTATPPNGEESSPTLSSLFLWLPLAATVTMTTGWPPDLGKRDWGKEMGVVREILHSLRVEVPFLSFRLEPEGFSPQCSPLGFSMC